MPKIHYKTVILRGGPRDGCVVKVQLDAVSVVVPALRPGSTKKPGDPLEPRDLINYTYVHTQEVEDRRPVYLYKG